MGIYSSYAGKIDIPAVSEIMQPVVENWFDGKIKIMDPHIEGGSYNRKTNKVTGRAPVEIWTGPARIQAMRWPNVATTRQEPVSIRTVVFHIPLSAQFTVKLIREGFRVQVLDGGMMPDFEDGLYVVTAGINTSYAWDRRIETMMDQGTTLPGS